MDGYANISNTLYGIAVEANSFTDGTLSIIGGSILQAKRIKVRKMIVASLDNYQLLKRNAYDDVEVLELAEVLALALGIQKKEREEPEEETVEDEQTILDSESSRRLEEDLQEKIEV